LAGLGQARPDGERDELGDAMTADSGETRPQGKPALSNTVSGTMRGSFVQAGAVHGDVYLHSAAEWQVPTPRQNPLPPRVFVDRELNRRELLEVVDGMGTQTGPALVVLHGPAGIGKQALAASVLAVREADFPHGQFHMRARHRHSGEVVAAETMLAHLLSALGVPPQRMPPRRYREQLWRSLTAGRRIALLLEDCCYAEQVSHLLPASPHALVIVTSTIPLPHLTEHGAVHLPVERLSTTSTTELLSALIGQTRAGGETDQVARLAALCGGWPLAVRLLAARITATPHRSLARTASELSQAHRQLAAFDTSGRGEELSLRSALDFTYAELPEEAARAYRLLGLAPGEHISAPLTAALIGRCEETAEEALGVLTDAQLLIRQAGVPGGDARYRFHRYVREHAAAETGPEHPDTKSGPWPTPDHVRALRRVLRWYRQAVSVAAAVLHPTATLPAKETEDQDLALNLPTELADQPSYATCLAWSEQYLADVLSAVRIALERGWSQLEVDLAVALQPLLLIAKHDTEQIQLLTSVVVAANDLGDGHLEFSLRKRLVRALLARGDYALARRHADILDDLADQHANLREQASARKVHGQLALTAGDSIGAVDALTAALNLLRQTGTPRSQALCLTALADAHLAAKGHNTTDIASAAAAAVEADTILTGLSTPDDYNFARNCITLGRIHIRTGKHADAEIRLRQALRTIREREAHYEHARAMRALAELADARGEEATTLRQQAQQLLRRVGRATEDDIGGAAHQ
jgi:tetratricopeptide (TPR) repeat protein